MLRRRSLSDMAVLLLLLASCGATYFLTKRGDMQGTFNMPLEEAIRLKGTTGLSAADKKVLAAVFRRRALEAVRHLKDLDTEGGLVRVETQNAFKQVKEACDK